VKRLLFLALAALLLLAPPGAGAQTSGSGADTYRPAAAAPDAIDINTASREALGELPVSPELARAIWEYRHYTAYFTSVYDLFKVPGMTPEDFAALRDRVIVRPRFAITEDADDDDRLEAVYDAAQRFLSQEGVSEGLVDEYIDLLRVPRNVNDMDYFALLGMQNVSPVDAVAVLRGRREKPYESTQELRRSEGLSYWGYRNLRDFVRFDDGEEGRFQLQGDAQIRVYNTPYELDDEDILVDQLGGDGGAAGPVLANVGDLNDFEENSLWGRLKVDQARPYVTTKLRARLGNEIKSGILTHRNLGEEQLDETIKWFGGVDNQKWGGLTLHRAYVGNYRLAFGHGLLMDNTDFYQARRTGMGFNVRPLGVRGDISRSDQSALKGGAVEASMGPVRFTGFYSNDDKDAILNPDFSFNRYVTMLPRVDNETLEEIADFLRPADRTHFLPMRNVMNEEIVGGNLKLNFLPGTYIGFTAMEMKYRNNLFQDAPDDSSVHRFNPDPATIIIEPSRIEARDAEFAAGYDNRALGNFRDLVGSEFGAVLGNLSLQGEYGKLLTTPEDGFAGRAFANGPEAYVGSAYLQYENFNVMALYRDYDIGYDNPYNRAFSETNRYDQTLAGDEFRLWNPLFSYLAENDPQSKPERGLYVTGRYQISRHLTLNYFEYDNYYRKVDNTQSQRMTVNFEYRPIFPVRLRVRHRYSERDGKGEDEVRGFRGWDSRFEARFYLSNFNRLDFLYSTTNVVFKSRPRLGSDGDIEGGTTTLGTGASPGQAFQAKYTHNFTPGLSATVSSEIYDGFLYNFEDNEFVAIDGTGVRNWFLVRSRLSERLSWRLKYTVDNQRPVTFLQIRNFENPVDTTGRPQGTAVKDNVNSFRFQLDYTF
jgi:hypothetical protein